MHIQNAMRVPSICKSWDIQVDHKSVTDKTKVESILFPSGKRSRFLLTNSCFFNLNYIIISRLLHLKLKWVYDRSFAAFFQLKIVQSLAARNQMFATESKYIVHIRGHGLFVLKEIAAKVSLSKIQCPQNCALLKSSSYWKSRTETCLSELNAKW